MILFILPLIALAANNLIGGIDYLFKLLFPPVPTTTPLSQPYTPPFTGGQCSTNYHIVLKCFGEGGGVYYSSGNCGRENSSTPAPHIGLFSCSANRIYGAIPSSATLQKTFTQGAGFRQLDCVLIGADGVFYQTIYTSNASTPDAEIFGFFRDDGLTDDCGNLPNPSPTLPIGGSGLPSSPAPVLYPPPNNPNNNWFPLIAGLAAVAATALTAATAAAAATAATAVTAATAAATAATAAIASAPSGSTIQQQSQSQKFSADALVGIAQVLAEVARQIAELEKEVRKLKTGEAKKEKDDAKKVIRYDFGSANRDGFIKLYPESNPDGFEATFVDVQIFNIPSGSGKYFGEKSPHYYKYKSLGQVHFVSPTFGILESREIDFARLSLNVPDNCFGFFYHFGLDGIVSANLSGFYAKTEKQAV